jgi:predicted MFS family arabinose efflux permease
MGALALILGLLTVTGLVQLWHVYVFAFLFGCSAALDAPVRQTFVAELVGDADLSNAIALNSTTFNAARMIGPAVAGLVIASVGTGWAFLFNGASFMAVLTSLCLLRTSELRPNARAHPVKGSVLQGFHYVRSRADLRATLIMLFLIGTFGLNFPIFISTMAVGVFHTDARGFGLLSSMMAIGTISGALLAASRERPRFASLLAGAATFGFGCTLAALAPSYWLFAAALVVIGVASLTIMNTSNALMQLSTEPAMRGRVMALRLGVALGGTPIVRRSSDGSPTTLARAGHLASARRPVLPPRSSRSARSRDQLPHKVRIPRSGRLPRARREVIAPWILVLRMISAQTRSGFVARENRYALFRIMRYPPAAARR